MVKKKEVKMTDLSSAIDSFVEITTGKKQVQKQEDPNLKQESEARTTRLMEVLVSMGVSTGAIETTNLPDYSTKLTFGHEKSNEKAKVELTIQPTTPYLVFIKTLYPIITEQRPVALMSPRLKEDLLGVLVPYFGTYVNTPPPVPAIVEPVQPPVEPIEPPVEPIIEPVPPPVEPVAIEEPEVEEPEVEEPPAKAIASKGRKKAQ
jgi:hypothetical protein